MTYTYHPGFVPTDQNTRNVRANIEKMSAMPDITVLRSLLSEILFTLADLVTALHTLQIQFPSWQQPFEGLLTKIIFHGAALNRMSEDLPIARNTQGKIVGFPSISDLYIISRAQMECYLMIHYLIIAPQDEHHGAFRHLLYQLSALQNRQQYHVSQPENIAKKEKEAEQISKLREQIENHSVFVTLDRNTKKRIQGDMPPARLFSWTELIRQSHLRALIFETRWKLYSNYAHSEYLSNIQLASYIFDPPALRKMVYHTVEGGILLTSILISDVLNLQPVLINGYTQSVSEEMRAYIAEYGMMGIRNDINK